MSPSKPGELEDANLKNAKTVPFCLCQSHTTRDEEIPTKLIKSQWESIQSKSSKPKSLLHPAFVQGWTDGSPSMAGSGSGESTRKRPLSKFSLRTAHGININWNQTQRGPPTRLQGTIESQRWPVGPNHAVHYKSYGDRSHSPGIQRNDSSSCTVGSSRWLSMLDIGSSSRQSKNSTL